MKSLQSPARTRVLCRTSRLALLCVFLGGCLPSGNEYQPPPPPTVTVTSPVVQPVTLFLEQTGETEPVQRAEVRARVRGFIQEILFLPGQRVDKGDLLYRIEPDTYRADENAAKAQLDAATAAIAVAEAEKSSAQARLRQSELDLDRQERLLASNAVSQAEYDAVLATRDANRSAVRSAEASIESAKAMEKQAAAAVELAALNLAYTNVKAPISGNITQTLVKMGNLVEIGTELATVVNRDQVYANFSISDRTLLRISEAMRKGNDLPITREEWSRTPVLLQRDTDSDRWFEGHLDYVSQEGIDVKTGSFAMRGIFPNDQNDLPPGMFVRIRVPVDELSQATLIPRRTVLRDPQGIFVLAVDSDNRVQRRPVTLGAELDQWVVVQKGLSANDRFVVDGLQRARPGMQVDPKLISLSTEDSPALRFSSRAVEDRAGAAKSTVNGAGPGEPASGTPESDDATDDPLPQEAP